jgi:hypothetical protein
MTTTTEPTQGPTGCRVGQVGARSATRQEVRLAATASGAAAALVLGLATLLPSEDATEWARALTQTPVRGWTSVVAFSTAEVAGAATLLLLATFATQQRRARARAGALVAAVGFLLNAVATPLAYAVAAGRAAKAVAGQPAAGDRVEAARFVVDLADSVNVGLLGVGLLLLARPLVGTGAVPRWFVGLGVAAGAAAVVGAAQLLLEPAAAVRVLSGLLYLAWLLALAALAWRHRLDDRRL